MKRKKKKYKTNSKTSRVSEPAELYCNAEQIEIQPPQSFDLPLHIFSSFEEMNEFDIKEMAKSTPQQRFENVTYMIQQRYAEELKKPLKEFTLHIGRRGIRAKRQRKIK